MSDTKLLSLSEIFNNKIFRIPDFQRGYSWEERQLDDFWEDIQNLSPNKIHYIGLLTVEPINANEVSNIEKWKDDLWLLKKGLSAYYVIDGQQRLTTLIILLHEILCTIICYNRLRDIRTRSSTEAPGFSRATIFTTLSAAAFPNPSMTSAASASS